MTKSSGTDAIDCQCHDPRKGIANDPQSDLYKHTFMGQTNKFLFTILEQFEDQLDRFERAVRPLGSYFEYGKRGTKEGRMIALIVPTQNEGGIQGCCVCNNALSTIRRCFITDLQ